MTRSIGCVGRISLRQPVSRRADTNSPRGVPARECSKNAGFRVANHGAWRRSVQKKPKSRRRTWAMRGLNSFFTFGYLGQPSRNREIPEYARIASIEADGQALVTLS